MNVFTGIAGSDGIAIGKALLYMNQPVAIDRNSIAAEQVASEQQRLKNAVQAVKKQIEQMIDKINRKVGTKEAEIFEAHLSVLEDPEVIDNAIDLIASQRIKADNAADLSIRKVSDFLSSLDDEYMKARSADILDVGDRLIREITGQQTKSLAMLPENCILVSHDITPSDTAEMDSSKVLAIVSEVGSKTSHAVILSRSLGIPAVIGVKGITTSLHDGDAVIVNGIAGNVIVHPDEQQLAKAEEQKEHNRIQRESILKTAFTNAVTLDGVTVKVEGNIGTPAETDLILQNGGDGIGLFRSELFYMNRNTFPTEEEQYNSYREVAEKMGEKQVIIRTMDIGGDKRLSYFDLPEEMNPFLGYRALRVSLEYTEVFKTQLRAILRASCYGNLAVMFPMVSCVEEIRQAKALLKECKEELKANGVLYNEAIKIGIMIEIPAIALQAQSAAKEVDFFSIGTNDLLQYSLAVDRMNDRVAHLYKPYHPGVLMLIKHIIESAHKEGIPVGMCGEMASDPTLAVILLGFGLHHFSMNPVSIPIIKDTIRSLSAKKCQDIADTCLTFSTGSEVESYILSHLKRSSFKN